MATERLTFEGSSGQELAARLELPPDGRPTACALFAHCFTCSKSSRAAVHVTRALSAMGMAVVRFDFTGLGESEGDFADTNFSSNVEDLIAAARHMEDRLQPPQILIGHSLGGAAVLRAASSLESVRAVSTIGAPAEAAHVLRHVESSRPEIERSGVATVSIAGRPFTVKKQFLADLDSQSMAEAVGALDRALLIFHSPTDEIVGIDNAARLYEMARHPKSFVSLEDADHLLSDPADSNYVGQVLAAWASRYIDSKVPEPDSEAIREEERVVTRTRKGGFFTEIQARKHALVADEPTSVGGEDAGPTPYDLLNAALGACTSMTLQMYAARKGWALDEATVRLKHRRLHKADSDESQREDSRLDLVEREIELAGRLDEDQRARLMEIADRCPVHRTLDAGVRIKTSEARSQV